MSSAILLLNHCRDAHLYSLLSELIADCEPDYDVWLLSDRTRLQLPLGKPPENTREFRFNVQDLRNLGYSRAQEIGESGRKLRNMKLGNAELPVILFSNQHPQYERLWVIEYDVRYSGNWKAFFDHFKSSDAALLTTTLTPYDQCKKWSHWHSISIPENSPAQSEWVRGFLPVYRVNTKALAVLDAGYRAGAAGHVEGLMPTLIKSAGLEIQDIGGNGPFVSVTNKKRFYNNQPACNTYSPGSFVYRPVKNYPGTRPDTLWHPVKPETGLAVRVARYLLRRLSW